MTPSGVCVRPIEAGSIRGTRPFCEDADRCRRREILPVDYDIEMLVNMLRLSLRRAALHAINRRTRNEGRSGSDRGTRGGRRNRGHGDVCTWDDARDEYRRADQHEHERNADHGEGAFSCRAHCGLLLRSRVGCTTGGR